MMKNHKAFIYLNWIESVNNEIRNNIKITDATLYAIPSHPTRNHNISIFSKVRHSDIILLRSDIFSNRTFCCFPILSRSRSYIFMEWTWNWNENQNYAVTKKLRNILSAIQLMIRVERTPYHTRRAVVFNLLHN